MGFLLELPLLLGHEEVILDFVLQVCIVGRVETQGVTSVAGPTEGEAIIGRLPLGFLWDTLHGLVVPLVGTSTVNEHPLGPVYQLLQPL